MSFLFKKKRHSNDDEIVTLFDNKQRKLDCYIEHSVSSHGTIYLLLMPVDIPIVIISWDDDDEEAESVEAVMLEDDLELESIFPNAKAVLAEHDLYLKHTAYTLTATGELPPIDEEQVLTLNIDEDDPDIDSEELQLLASFYHSSSKYSIYTPLTPLLFFARYNSKNRIELVSPSEEGFQPILEELLFEESE